MDRRAVLLLAVVGLAFASTVSAKCVGTAERPAHLITLDKGGSFCLRLPRYLPNPEKALAGTASFPRTVKDTCGLYAITLHVAIPKGAGPVPHLHLADEEFFMPTTPNNTVRLFAQSDAAKLRIYKPGEVPGWTVPNITDVGHVDVPYGRIGYSPAGVPHSWKAGGWTVPNVTGVGHADVAYGRVEYSPAGIPHSWKAVNDMQNFIAIWLTGFVMIPSVNIPAVGTNVSDVMGQTSMWGSPTDITSGMIGGPDFITRGLAAKAALPPATRQHLQRIQKAFDAGEACFPK